MSWQGSSSLDEMSNSNPSAYVDSSLVGTGAVDKAAIYSKAGDSTWAISPGFQVTCPVDKSNDIVEWSGSRHDLSRF